MPHSLVVDFRQKELNLATVGAEIQIKRFAVGKQLKQIAKSTHSRTFVKPNIPVK